MNNRKILALHRAEKLNEWIIWDERKSYRNPKISDSGNQLLIKFDTNEKTHFSIYCHKESKEPTLLIFWDLASNKPSAHWYPKRYPKSRCPKTNAVFFEKSLTN